MNVIRSKFRGCLAGALLGDALGQIFEGQYWNEPVPKERFGELSKEKLVKLKESSEFLPYTDDTAMTKAICRSLLSQQSFNVNDMAKAFVEEYFREPWRGYGAGVVTVFQRLHTEKHDDVLLPAREQFNGEGSYGNGAAMRVSPLALFYSKDFEQLKIVSINVLRQLDTVFPYSYCIVRSQTSRSVSITYCMGTQEQMFFISFIKSKVWKHLLYQTMFSIQL